MEISQHYLSYCWTNIRAGVLTFKEEVKGFNQTCGNLKLFQKNTKYQKFFIPYWKVIDHVYFALPRLYAAYKVITSWMEALFTNLPGPTK